MADLALKFTDDERRVVAESFAKLEQAELAYHSTLAVIARLHGLHPIGLRVARDWSGFEGARAQAPMPTMQGGRDEEMPDLNGDSNGSNAHR